MKQFYSYAAALIVVLLIFAGLIITPAGKALAEEILRFFNPAAGTSFPLPPEEIFPVPPTDTPEPTHAAQLLPAEQVLPLTPQATPTPFLNLSAEQMQNLDSITAQTLVDFPVKAPGYLPNGFRLQRIFYDEKNRTVSMEYGSTNSPDAPALRIVQGKALIQDLVMKRVAGEDIQINGVRARLEHGSWTDASNNGHPIWQDNPDDFTILWQAEEHTISLQTIHNAPSKAAYIRQDDLIKAAESMSHCQDRDYSCNLQQAGVAAGFIPWQFRQAPDGLSFKNSYYLPSQTAIWYGGMDGELGVLQSRNDFSSEEDSEWFSVPPDAIQKVNVAGQPAEYVNGSFINYVGEDHATWDPDSGQIRLRWKNGDYWFQIVKWGEPELEPQELADLAGMLTDDPERVNTQEQEKSETRMGDIVYENIADIREAAGYEISLPSILPVGLPFSHARLTSPSSVMLFYGDFMPNKITMKGPCLTISQINETGIPFDDIYKLYPKNAIEAVQVNGWLGKVVHGMIMMNAPVEGQPTPIPEWIDGDKIITLYWETSEKSYSISYNPTLASGLRLNNEEMVKIAESLK